MTLSTIATAGLLFAGAGATAQAKTPPPCSGDYKPGVVCQTGNHPAGTFTSAAACDKQGRYYVDNVRLDTRDGPVGWYTWECNPAGESWILNLKGVVLK